MALKAGYAPKGVEFLMIDSVLGETRDKVMPAAKAAGIDMPILFDYEQLVGDEPQPATRGRSGRRRSQDLDDRLPRAGRLDLDQSGA